MTSLGLSAWGYISIKHPEPQNFHPARPHLRGAKRVKVIGLLR